MNKTYRTIQGDMWDKIAYEQMGSVLYTDQLIKDMQLPPWKRGILE